ncbi:LysR family transcriptional regulator [Legionella waltersii]|uniref:LysR family transporter transcriptional regulator n=1 Tax=Legionella waltersii TaxID=66969 RepID=A0A0W1A1S7_9GAMM|nr:LysR family transcriptional regulator [Legionella waltersii]KTD75295.1 LysR family transporter transcriptional regulator [Legionella waltersii]SNV06983.1 transcriptional regulator [Legionella waltersii]
MNILHCLKSFLFTVDCGSFSAAARTLYISPSKLSKQISWLEDELKVKLFVRSTRQLTLTESGQRLYGKVIKLFDELEQVKSIASTEHLVPHGTIQLYLTVTPAIPYLTQLSIQFMQEYPKIKMDILVGSEDLSTYQHPFDLAISFDAIKHPKLLCNKLFSIRRKIYASPDYINKHGSPKTIEDLANYNCLINTLYSLQNKWIFNKKVIHVNGNFKSNSADILKQAAIEGIGLIWTPSFSVLKEIQEGQLVPVLPDDVSPEIALYSIYPKHLADATKIRLLMDFFYTKALQDRISEG